MTSIITLLQRLLIPPTECRWILLLFGGLLAVVVLKDLRKAAQRLMQEEEYLQLLAHQLRNTDRLTSSEELDRALAGIPQDSLVHALARTLWDIRLMNNPNLEALSGVLAQGQAALLGFSRVTPNIFLLVGLLGTVIGLAGVVGSLNLSLDVTSQLPNALVHMRSAFACTIWGILLSISATCVVRLAVARQNAFFAALDKFTLCQMAPRILPLSQESAVAHIEQVLADSNRFMREVAGIMSQAASYFSTTLTTAGIRMEEGLRGLADASEKSRMTAETVNAAAEHVGRAASALQINNEELLDSYNKLRDSYNKLQQLFSDMQARYREMSDEQFRRVQGIEVKLDETSMKILGGLESNGNKLLDSANIMHRSSQEFVDAKNQTLFTIGESVKELVRDLNDPLRQVIANIQHAEEQLLHLHTQSSSSIREGFHGLSADLNSTFSDHQEFITNTRIQVDHLSGQLGGFTDRLCALQFPVTEMSGLTHALLGVQESLRQLSGEMGKRMTATSPAMLSASSISTDLSVQIDPKLGRTLNDLQGSMQHLEILTEGLERELAEIKRCVDYPWWIRFFMCRWPGGSEQ